MSRDCGNVQKIFVAIPVGETLPSSGKGIAISDLASAKIVQFIEGDDKDPLGYALCISVTPDGCSGLSYKMDIGSLDQATSDGHKIFKRDNAHVVIEKKSYFYVIGSTLDYVEALTGSGFSLNNPNIKRSCSCGSSFAVTKETVQRATRDQ